MISAISLFCVVTLQRDVINVRVNGARVNPGKTFHNRTMVPTRGVLEKLGVEVRWVPATRSVIASNADTTIVLGIGKNSAQVNGRDLPLETPPFIEAGTTYVPLRFIAESMHARVGYEASTNTATVDLDAAQTQPTPTAGELGTLRPVPSNWFIPGTKMHFEISGPENMDLALTFDPHVDSDVRFTQHPDGTYTADWTPPQDGGYGAGAVRAIVLNAGHRTGKEVNLSLDDPRLVQMTPPLGQAFEGTQLWVKMRDNTGPGFDVRGVSVTLNGQDVTSNAQITDQDIKLDLPRGQNDIHLSIRDQAGKQLYFDTSAFVVSKSDPYLTYDAPNPVRQGDRIRFHVHGPTHSRFAILLGDSIRIPADLIREVSPGDYEAEYLVGPNDRLDRAPVRAVWDQGPDPLLSSPISIVPWSIDRVRGQAIDGGTLIQAYGTPGARMTYFGPDGSSMDFTEQASSPGSYLLTVPSPTGTLSSVIRPYIRLRSADVQSNLSDISVVWPERDLRIARLWPADGARVTSVPQVIKVSVDTASGPGLDPSSVQMWLDGQPVRNVSLFNGTDASFQPDSGLQAGDHSVQLFARDLLGRSLNRQWRFSLRPGSNPSPQITQFEFFGRGDITGGQSTSAQFQVAGMPTTAQLTVTSSAPAIVGVPSTVAASSGNFPITSQKVSQQTHVNITLSYGNASAVLPLTIEPGVVNVAPQLTELIALPFKDHDAPKAARISLSIPAPGSGITVQLRSLTPNLIKVGTTAFVRSGSTQVAFAVTPLGVDTPQVAQIQADIPGSTKFLRIPLTPSKLSTVTVPNSVPVSTQFTVTFTLRSPMGPSGGTLKITGGLAKVLEVSNTLKIPAGATSVTTQISSLPVNGLMTVTGELNGSKLTTSVKVGS